MEGVQGRREKNSGSKWTEDRKKRHSEKMKEYWRKRKEQGIKNWNWHVVLRWQIQKKENPPSQKKGFKFWSYIKMLKLEVIKFVNTSKNFQIHMKFSLIETHALPIQYKDHVCFSSPSYKTFMKKHNVTVSCWGLCNPQ